jgi:hypothetical protein
LSPKLIDIVFADVLRSPGDAITRLAVHYDLDVPDDLDTRIKASSWLGRYAKDERQVFDAATRRQELVDSAARHAEAIASGVRWAECELAARQPQAEYEFLQARLRP